MLELIAVTGPVDFGDRHSSEGSSRSFEGYAFNAPDG
jgi:hypothetical protein